MIIVVVFGIALSILASEYMWRKKIIRGEFSRKLLQITLGTIVAFSPFYLSWGEVQFLAAGSLGMAVIMHFSGIFKSMYDVKRRSGGDIVGPVVFAALAVIMPHPWIFAAAVLHVALADGLAAVIGTAYGKKSNYKVFNNTKSVAGTVTFYLVSYLIILGVLAFSGLTFGSNIWLLLVGVPVVATITENISGYGLDNITIIVVVTGMLTLLS